MLSEFKTEIIGISAEVAIADEYKVSLSDAYRYRADERIISMTRKVVKTAFGEYKIPAPENHIAEGQNPIDFILANGKTLSVKSNQYGLGKVAPQNIGQPTAATYWTYFKDFADGIIPADYKGKADMFKRVSLSRIEDVMTRYWENIFDCDYLLHFYDFLDETGNPNSQPKFIVFNRKESPVWNYDKFTFTQNAKSWNESNTVKYCDVTIGEFQVHKHRDCFKFRFNMDGIVTLTKQGVI